MGAHLLERLPLFEGLVSSLVNDSELWREYLQHEVSLTSVIPLPTQSPLNNFLRVVILLTKLRPEKVNISPCVGYPDYYNPYSLLKWLRSM